MGENKMKEFVNRKILKKAASLSIVVFLLSSTVAVMANTMNDQTSIMFKELGDIQIEELSTEEIEPGNAERDILFEDGFESYNDFVLNFPPWTQYDGDKRPTCGISGYTFPNQGYVGSFIIFNPSQVTPPLQGHPPHSGQKYAACFDAVPPPFNNDWLITPQLSAYEYDQLSFWARSLNDAYGLEKIQVGVSTTDNDPSSFEIISQLPYIEVPIMWTQYTYDLSDYNGEDIYIAIHCVSEDAFALFVDDFQVTGTSGGPSDFIVQIENTTAIPGILGHTFNITGSFSEEIFGYYLRLSYGPTQGLNDIIITNVTLDGSVAEGAMSFDYTWTNYGYSGLLDILVVYYSPIEPGFGIPAGSGKLATVEVWVSENAEPQIINITQSPMGDSLYIVEAGAMYLDLFINGTLEIVPPNSPPPAPNQPSGPTEGTTGEVYTYTTDVVVDPDGDDVEYFFDWGDGNDSSWVAEPTADYTWMSAGSFAVKVKARDIPYGEESDWSPELEVTISEAMPELEITTISGGLGVSAGIKNIGNADAIDVNWSITLDGGLILLGKETADTITSIAAEDQATVQSSLIFGIGKTMIIVNAECAEGSSDEKTAEGFVLLFFVLGVQ